MPSIAAGIVVPAVMTLIVAAGTFVASSVSRSPVAGLDFSGVAPRANKICDG